MPVRTQAEDLRFGYTHEQNVLERLQKQFGTTLLRGGNWDTMDYSNTAKTIFIELKSRRVPHDRYPTAIIGRNKVRFCSDPTKEYYFVYNYEDGLFYIKYDPELFATFEVVTEYQRNRRADATDAPQEVVMIPYKYLTRFN
jgi:hypothetical protein